MDAANVLSPAVESELTALSAALEQRRTDQFVIVTVPSLEGQTIERYSLEHFNAWGIGRADVNNGVMLLVAPNERKVRIETGRGTRVVLPDADCLRIIETVMLPRFQNRDFDGGVTAGARAIIERLEQAPAWPQPATPTSAPSAARPESRP
jgi:uncharacterized protein